MRKWTGSIIVVAMFIVLIVLFTVILPPLADWAYIVISLSAMAGLVVYFYLKTK